MSTTSAFDADRNNSIFLICYNYMQRTIKKYRFLPQMKKNIRLAAEPGLENLEDFTLPTNYSPFQNKILFQKSNDSVSRKQGVSRTEKPRNTRFKTLIF